MLCLLKMADNLFVMILVRHLRRVSSSIIGLVLVRSHSQSLGLGIENRVLVFQEAGQVLLAMQSEKNSLMTFLAPVSNLFIIS